jgi:hypothetical protein
MFEYVISGGDSFTFGAELSDDNGMNPSKNSWASHVAKKLGNVHINVAKSGRSNSYIARHIIYQIQSAINKGYDPTKFFVQVMWTFADRHELAAGHNTHDFDPPWVWITPYSNVDESQSDWFKSLNIDTKNLQFVKNDLHERYLKNKKIGLVEYVDAFFKLTQGTPHNDSYTTVKEIVYLQNFLKVNGINYIFMFVDYHARNNIFTDCEKGLGTQYLNTLRSSIDMSHWFSFEGNVGFNDWARKNNYKYATSHPLEDAHQAAADIIYNHIIKNIINKGQQ